MCDLSTVEMGRTQSAKAGSAASGNGIIHANGNGVTREVEKQSTAPVKGPRLSERTDYSRWRLLDEAGRQTWQYLEDDEDAAEWPQSTADKYFLGLPLV